MNEVRSKLVKQVERGIFDVPPERLDEVLSRIAAVQTDADLAAFRAWMDAEGM